MSKNLQKSISCLIRALRYSIDTKTDVQETKNRILEKIAQWKLKLGCNK